MNSVIKYYQEDYYFTIEVSEYLFDSLDESMLISGGCDRVKYMCANQSEQDFVEDLIEGYERDGCDWFKFVLVESV